MLGAYKMDRTCYSLSLSLFMPLLQNEHETRLVQVNSRMRDPFCKHPASLARAIITLLYSVVQKIFSPVWNSRLMSAKQNGQPMHSQLALTEHVSLNLAPLILLDLLYHLINGQQ